MKTKIILFFLMGIAMQLYSQKFIADYSIAKEDVLRNIPQEYINLARNKFKIAYQHTSHGTHVSRGLYGLQEYKFGDDILFGITNNNSTADKLEFHDYAISAYGISAADLSVNETAFIQATRNFLDSPENADINLVMWAWCNIKNHKVSENYLPGMQTLIDEYGVGGSKIGIGEGKREIPVYFIFMTGHANVNNNIGEGKPKSQAELITNFCKANGYFCLDYYSIDTHCMDDNYWEDSGDDGQSETYGGNFYIDFQTKNVVGSKYYQNKETPGGRVAFGEHNTQHITANRKAFAMWWILARLAGYSGESSKEANDNDINDFYFNQDTSQIICSRPDENASIKVYNMSGTLLSHEKIAQNNISLSHLNKGVYVVVVGNDYHTVNKKVVLN